MSATPALTAELRVEVTALEEDLRERLAILPDVRADWLDEHRRAAAAERTAVSWEEWSADRITQAAVAWVLATVFVRFCEDNGLVRPVWISGPGARRQESLDAQAEFVRTESRRIDPATGEPVDVTDREWLRQAIDYLGTLAATAGLVDSTSPLWTISPSGDGAGRLLAFWRERDETGARLRDLTDPELDTRFLGDLYQHLSEAARLRYALLQTPVFVEEFILDRTLEPALTDRPLDDFRLIDPACGSGHFLLGAFARLHDRWARAAPALDERERVQRALDAIHGVDVNPFAVAIARFRLTVGALRASGLVRLEDAPAFRFHLAVGDSLLHGGEEMLPLDFTDDPDALLSGFAYSTEDLTALREILRPGRYDVVVGNPPYITVKDPALNKAYRRRYRSCKGTYAMTVPFMERFFDLAKSGERAGWVGQITSNSFMKREFGSKLIEDFLPTVDLVYVIDSEGAWIPGHNADGTPTVILVGRRRLPASRTVRAVLSKGRREGRNTVDGTGPYWSAIVGHLDDIGWDDDWVTVADLGRSTLAHHPWSLAGGGALELRAVLETSSNDTVESLIEPPIGGSIRAGADEAFIRPKTSCARRSSTVDVRSLVVGDEVRDWGNVPTEVILYPYDYGTADAVDRGISGELWPYRQVLAARSTFQGFMADAGLQWWEYMQHTAATYRTPLSIVFAEVATHNHFVLDRGSRVFKQTAPVIKLPKEAEEARHFALLNVLNSSTACFWLKTQSQPKGGAADHLWLRTYQFTGTTLQDFPLPASLPTERGRVLDGLSQRLGEQTPEAVCAAGVPTREALKAAREENERIRAEMIAQQEEADWAVYRLYGLVDDDLTYGGDDLPSLALGERAFEVVFARRIAAGEEVSAWFTRHGSTPMTEIPLSWPAAYGDLVSRRIELAAAHPYLQLLEKPEHKRRWEAEPWEKQEERALRGWLLDRLEDRRFWFDQAGRPLPRSVGQLADEVSRDRDLVGVLALWEGRPDLPVSKSLGRLLDGAAVPFLAAFRYKEPGLRKRAAWEHTWALQRKEDAGTYDAQRDGPIPVPPKYISADFTKLAYWSHRGKLDVPKERFILYSAAGRDTDPTALLGWAGWDHAQQALALARLIQDREADGWDDDRLVPLVAGLGELQPWLDQWHADPDAFYGGISAADYFRGELDTRSRQVGRTPAQLAAWRAAPARRGRPQRTTS